MDVSQIVSRRIREAREGRGWSRAELGTRAGLSERALRSYEGGHRSPTCETLAQLADALGVGRGWLLGDDEGQPAPTPEAVEQMMGSEAGRDAVLGGLSRFVSKVLAR